MHEQNPTTYEVWTHQQHYAPQITEIPCDTKALVPDEHPADEDMKQLYMSLVGAMAGLIMTMPAICIYVASSSDKHSRQRSAAFDGPTAFSGG